MDSGNTAWVLASAALVLLMTPGVALFYGGMVRARSVVNMLLMSFTCLAVVSVIWPLFGFSLAFGPDAFGGLIGNFEYVGMAGLLDAESGTVPMLAFASFQLMFAIITPALITGAIADRAKFSAWVIFATLWVCIVYLPVAHWVFAFDDGNGGWIGDRLGAIDFAGGTAVHVNAGAAALALAIVLGKRAGWPTHHNRPHNLPLVLLGAGLLWFGWFGFNAGSALAADGLAAAAFFNTQVAAGAGALAWILVERLRTGHVTTLGMASGVVAGLVAITPACAAVNAVGALAIGIAAGGICAYAVELKFRLGYDDSLDVVGVHLVGGVIGSLLIGLFATATIGGVDGLLYGGGWLQLGKQALAVAAVGAYSFVLSFALGKAIDRFVGFRVVRDHELAGVDLHQHRDISYEFLGTNGHGQARDGDREPVPSGQ